MLKSQPTARWRVWGTRLFAPAMLVVLACLVVLWQDPWHLPLNWDPGIYALVSQYVAQGLAPHRDAFNEQASLTFLFGGAAMWLGDRFGLHHLIAFRLASLLTFAAVTVLTYAVGWAFSRSRWVGMAAGIILVGFTGYSFRVAQTLEPKAFMLLFGLTALYLLTRRKWFWAGAFAAAAGLAWQIGWGYLAVTLLLAALQGGNDWRGRGRALGRVLAASALVGAAYLLFFVAHSAQVEMLQQTFLAPFILREDAARPVLARVEQLARYFVRGYPEHLGFGVLALVGFVVWQGAHLVPWRRGVVRRGRFYWLGSRRTAGTLLATLGFMLYLLYDFQNYPDWIPLLPFVAIFAAWLIVRAAQFALSALPLSPPLKVAASAALLGILCAFSLVPTAAASAQGQLRRTWQEQQAVADELNRVIPADAPVWIIGQAETLFFMRRQNVNKYIYLFGKVDAAADAFEPGGLRQAIIDAQTAKPVLYVLARLDGDIFANPAYMSLLERAHNPYILLEHCGTIVSGRYFVRADVADALFPPGDTGCVTRGKN